MSALFRTLLIFSTLLVAKTEAIVAGENATRTIYLIRHGDYDHNDKRDPDIGRALIPLGIAQARLVAARLKSLPAEITSLHSSTMTRARETAEVINESFPNLELSKTRILRECTPATWRQDILEDEKPEDLETCKNQLEKAFTNFFVPSPDSTERHDVLVCHGNVIRYLVTKALKVDSLAWLGMSISNCSLTIIKVKPDGSMKLQGFNDTGHIPPNLHTFTGGKNSGKKLVVKTEKESENH